MKYLLPILFCCNCVFGGNIDQEIDNDLYRLKCYFEVVMTAVEYFKFNTNSPEERQKLLKEFEKSIEGRGFNDCALDFFNDNKIIFEGKDNEALNNPKNKKIVQKACLFVIYSAIKNIDLPLKVQEAYLKKDAIDKIKSFLNKTTKLKD